MLKTVFVFPCLMALLFTTNAQILESINHGRWDLPSTWSAGIVPDGVNAQSVIVHHDVDIPEGY